MQSGWVEASGTRHPKHRKSRNNNARNWTQHGRVEAFVHQEKNRRGQNRKNRSKNWTQHGWATLPGETHLLVAPNSEHSLSSAIPELIPSLVAFIASIDAKEPPSARPQFSYAVDAARAARRRRMRTQVQKDAGKNLLVLHDRRVRRLAHV